MNSTQIQINTVTTLLVVPCYYCLQTLIPSLRFLTANSPLSLHTYLTLRSHPINFGLERLFLANMKLTNIVALLCTFSLSLATKAPNSHLLPGYQHGYLQHSNASNFSSSTNLSTNAPSLLAPLYHNVTTGGAWVLPASPFDLGARAMTCECFDPDGMDTCSFVIL